MTIAKERFDSGLTYDAYKAGMTRNRERLEENERNVALDPDVVQFFRGLSRPLNVVALVEDWCGDVIANLPVLGKLAKEARTLNLRIFYRDQNPDLMQRWLNEGKYQSIPVFAFFDDRMGELAHWIERPSSVTQLRAEKRKAIYDAHPEFGAPDAPVDQLPEDVRARLQEELRKMRDGTTAFANAEVQRELRDLVSLLPVR